MGSKSIPSTIITTLKQKAAGSCCDLQRKSKNKIQKKRRDESGRGEIESISLPEGAMQPQASPAPLSETRFFRGNNMIYKFKIRCNSGYRRQCFSQELEKIIRTVLGNLSSLQPFSSDHFNVFPYKMPCRAKAEVMCRRCGRNFQVFPFVLIVCLEDKKADPSSAACSREEQNVSSFIKEEKSERVSPVLKRFRSDPPLEGAVLQAIMKDLEDASRAQVISQQRGRAFLGEEAKERAGVVDEDSGSEYPEMQLATQQSTSEEEPDEEGEEDQSGPETPPKPGLLSRLASYIFPSLSVKEP